MLVREYMTQVCSVIYSLRGHATELRHRHVGMRVAALIAFLQGTGRTRCGDALAPARKHQSATESETRQFAYQMFVFKIRAADLLQLVVHPG